MWIKGSLPVSWTASSNPTVPRTLARIVSTGARKLIGT
jgi:hypothetical protein